MFKILDVQNIEAETLEHSGNIFYEAMEKGKEYYHVKCDMGDYDLKLIENDSLINGDFQKRLKCQKSCLCIIVMMKTTQNRFI